MKSIRFALLLTCCVVDARAAELVDATLDTKLVPGPAKYSVLLPDGYAGSGKTYPLFLFLHGGGGNNGFLGQTKPQFEEVWKANLAPEMVVVTPDCGRSFYMDYKDGSQRWETFILAELVPKIRASYRVGTDSKSTFIGGISMGGMGSLRMAFKRPDVFGAVVSFEPGIEPAFEWPDVKLEDRFWRSPALMEEKFGKPMDNAYWAANNPATILRDHAEAIRASGLIIYIEVGSEDAFGLDRGTEFLHRLLYDQGIRHEYRYVRGADHVGKSVPERIRNGLAFLARATAPPEDDPALKRTREQIQTWKEQAGLKP